LNGENEKLKQELSKLEEKEKNNTGLKNKELQEKITKLEKEKAENKKTIDKHLGITQKLEEKLIS